MSNPRHVVFGPTGEIGRWLVAELTGAGDQVAVIMRNAGARRDTFAAWIAAHGGNARQLVFIEGDVTRDRLGIDELGRKQIADARLIYNLSARYAWGLSKAEAAAVNVRGAERVIEFAATLPARPRVVHASGYLVASELRLKQLGLRRDETPTQQQWARLYRDLGAYEASKMEGDFAVRADAKRRAVDLTIVNPAAVIGHSETGEIGQITGFGELVDQLWRGVMTAIPGSPDSNVPQVPIDYLAKFLARVPAKDTAAITDYTVLCPDTPRFADLIRLVANHIGVRAPKAFIPVGLAKVLIKGGLGKLTGTSAEPLSFLVPLEFDATAADAAAARVGLTRPPVVPVIQKTLDHIVATRFGAMPSGRGGFRRIANINTFVDGDISKADTILLHGLPLTGSSWDVLRSKLERHTLAADLPGQGRSELVAPGDELAWLAALASAAQKPLTVIAHSYACRAALSFASLHPSKVANLVLIAPYSHLPLLPLPLRFPIMAAPLLRLAGGKQLAKLDQSSDHLRRPGAPKSAAQRLQIVASRPERAALRDLLDDVVRRRQTRVLVIEGGNDRFVRPLPAGVAHAIIAGAGHNPQMTHSSEVADAIMAIESSDDAKTLAIV